MRIRQGCLPKHFKIDDTVLFHFPSFPQYIKLSPPLVRNPLLHSKMQVVPLIGNDLHICGYTNPNSGSFSDGHLRTNKKQSKFETLTLGLRKQSHHGVNKTNYVNQSKFFSYLQIQLNLLAHYLTPEQTLVQLVFLFLRLFALAFKS